MAKIKELAEKPPEARGTPAEQLRQLRDYLYRVMKELEFLLTHLGKDNLAEGLRKEIEAGGGGNPVQLGEIALGVDWDGESGMFSQPATVTGAKVTERSKVDLQLSAEQFAQLVIDGVTGLTTLNDSGELTVWAVGAVPSTAMTIQCTVTEVE